MVQTFVVEETKELIYDAEKIDEWKAKCEELGLTAQLLLATKDKSPMPFECMNAVSQRVYETLCPQKVEYRAYAKTAIPLEVLGLISLAEQEGYFESIEIWYDDKAPDPIAVGLLKDKANAWITNYHPIARWGDVLRPFDELKEKAIQVYKNSTRLQLLNSLSEIKSRLDNIDVNTEMYFDAQKESYQVAF